MVCGRALAGMGAVGGPSGGGNGVSGVSRTGEESGTYEVAFEGDDALRGQ